MQEQPQDSSVGPDLAQRLAVHAAADYGLSLRCERVVELFVGECVSGTKAYATVTVQARLPLLPSFMGGGVIPVSSHATSWGLVMLIPNGLPAHAGVREPGARLRPEEGSIAPLIVGMLALLLPSAR